MGKETVSSLLRDRIHAGSACEFTPRKRRQLQPGGMRQERGLFEMGMGRGGER